MEKKEKYDGDFHPPSSPSAPPPDEDSLPGGLQNLALYPLLQSSSGNYLDPPPPYFECASSPSSSFTENANNVANSSNSTKYPSTESEIRAILTQHFHGSSEKEKKAATDMKIVLIKPTNAYSYTIDAFTEKRTLVENCAPYKKQYVDGKKNGPIPDKWTLEAKPPVSFAKANHSIPLPHSGSVVDCTGCAGKGKKNCGDCGGKGFKMCKPCFGSGLIEDTVKERTSRCTKCTGTGKIKCRMSNCTSGLVTCSKCQGHKSLVYSQTVKVTWDCFDMEYVTERGGLKEKQLTSASSWERMNKVSKGQEEGHEPLKWEKDLDLEETAVIMLKSALKRQNENLKILEVRQRIGEIPVVQVLYSYKGEDGAFYIYSTDFKVYFPKKLVGSACVCF